MYHYLALLFLPIAFLLSYPIGYVFEKVGNKVSALVIETRTKWDSAYRD